MKKALAITLALVFVLSYCGSAFAATDNLTMTFSTAIVKGDRVNTFQYCDADGRLVREEIDTLGNAGQLNEKVVTIFNEQGQKASERVAGLDKDGNWRDDQAFWTYRSDGAQVVDSRTVYTKPDMTQKFERAQVIVYADGNSEGRGEGRDAFGNKLYDMTVSHQADSSEVADIIKYTYSDGSASTEINKKLSDGTEIKNVINDNAAGQAVRQTSYQQNTDGSYDKSSMSIRYQDNGNRFVSESTESMDKDGNRKTSYVSYNLNADGFGTGVGVYNDADGRRALIDVEFRDDGEEGKVCATTYRFSDGTVDLQYEVTTPDGKVTKTYEENVKNYDGGDDLDFDNLPAEDPFDTWNEVFDDLNEESYTGDPSALESDDNINYYESEVDWDSVSDWGWNSDWDDAFNWE